MNAVGSLLCSLSQRLKVVLPETDFSIDAAHEVSSAELCKTWQCTV